MAQYQLLRVGQFEVTAESTMCTHDPLVGAPHLHPVSTPCLQERRSIAAEGLTLRRLSGEDITPAHWDAFYKFYINTSGARPPSVVPGSCSNEHCIHSR